MKLRLKAILATIGLVGLLGAIAIAGDREIEFSAYSPSWDTDAYNAFSSSYDVSVKYKIPGGVDIWSGWRDDFPVESLTDRDFYIEEGDFVTYAAQWDTSTTVRTNFDPATADLVVFY